MKISPNAVNLLKDLEQLRLNSYSDGGKFSIGYGHQVLPHETHLITQTITETHAEILLRSDLKRFEEYVNKFSIYIENQNQFDALVIFAFNVGSWGANFQKHLVSGNQPELIKVWRTYNKSGNTVLRGLTDRREMEISLFLSGSFPSGGAIMALGLFIASYFLFA